MDIFPSIRAKAYEPDQATMGGFRASIASVLQSATHAGTFGECHQAESRWLRWRGLPGFSNRNSDPRGRWIDCHYVINIAALQSAVPRKVPARPERLGAGRIGGEPPRLKKSYDIRALRLRAIRRAQSYDPLSVQN